MINQMCIRLFSYCKKVNTFKYKKNAFKILNQLAFYLSLILLTVQSLAERIDTTSCFLVANT